MNPDKWQLQNQGTIIKIMEYIHIHPSTNQNSLTKIKYNRLTLPTKETKNDIHQLRTKLIKAQTRKQN